MRRPFLPLSMPWPAPALLAWLLAWSLWAASQRFGLSPSWAFALAAAAGLLAAVPIRGRWRRLLVALGFALSALASGASMPAWAWPLAIAPLLLAYPPRAWRDAPFFPTPVHALDGLDALIELPPDARVLDAGCGIGHGLAALRRLWPRAQLQGIEWSRPLAWLAAWRCPWAQLARGDMWATSWRGFDLVYLFQRPESMASAMAKAEAEMAPGAWLVSLEFGVPGCTPTASLQDPSRRGVWAYRIGGSDDIATPASTERRKRR
ncbi:MAG: class I SAM-dependent methyltransferase [Burkholderiaceae bacterium]|nr:class I SAM-dependent methyltransferase [Burkholderiaceae bacterium]